LVGSTERRKETATGFEKAEKCKGSGTVASVNVFKARALG